MDFFSSQQVVDYIDHKCNHPNCVDIIIKHTTLSTLFTTKRVTAELCKHQIQPHQQFAHLWLSCDDTSHFQTDNLRELGFLPTLDLFDATESPLKSKFSVEISSLWKKLIRPVFVDQYQGYTFEQNPMADVNECRYDLMSIWLLRLEIDKALIKHDITNLDDNALSMLVLENEQAILNDRISFWMSMLAAMERAELAGIDNMEKWFYSCEQRIFEFRQQFHVDHQSTRIAEQFGVVITLLDVLQHFQLDINTQHAILFMIQKYQTPHVLAGSVQNLLFLLDPQMGVVVYNGIVFVPCHTHNVLFSVLFHRHMKAIWKHHKRNLKPFSKYLEFKRGFDCFDAGGRLTDHFSDLLDIEKSAADANRVVESNYGYKGKPGVFKTSLVPYEQTEFDLEDIHKIAPECVRTLFKQAQNPTADKHNMYEQRLLVGRLTESFNKSFEDLDKFLRCGKQDTADAGKYTQESLLQAKQAFAPGYERRAISCDYMIRKNWCPKQKTASHKTPQQQCSSELHERFNFAANKQNVCQVKQPKWYMLQASKQRQTPFKPIEYSE